MSDAKPSLTWEEAVETLRTSPEAADLVKACFYDDPLVDAADRYWKSSEWAAIRALLPVRPGTALDVGAGRGIAAYAFAKDGWAATALEPDASKVVGAGAIRDLAEATGTPIEVVEEWGEQLPFADASFDVVHCRAVLHHAHDLEQLCRQVARVLKPKGLFIATREHVVTSEADISAFQDAHPLHRLYGGEYAYTLDQYTGALTAAGFALRNVFNPFQSDINMYPSSRSAMKERWRTRLRLPSGRLIPDAALALRGRLSNAPGRLYTFVGAKA